MAPSLDNLTMPGFLYGGIIEISGSLSQMRWMDARIIPGLVLHLPRESVLSFVWDFLSLRNLSALEVVPSKT